MKKAVYTIFVAAILWTIMFCPITAPYVNFWWMMTASACTLSLLATFFGRDWWKDVRIDLSNILLGIVIAVALWSVFWIGDKLSQLMCSFASPQVEIIYGMKDGESPLLLTLLMLFLIGPAEEIFWRGYIQKSFSQYWNPNVGMVVTTAIYSLVHAGSCNFMLTMAALVAGLAWGIMYRFFPEKFGAIIISHALWDVAVFIWFPI